jgi:hypothetical protein
MGLVRCPCLMKYVFCALMAMVLLLNSCIDGEEEIFVHANGSASLRVKYQVPGMIFSAEDADELVALVGEEVGGNEALRLVTNRVDSEKGQRVIRIEVETDSVMELDGMFDEISPQGGVEQSKTDKLWRCLLGKMDVKVDGLSVGITRKVDLEPLLNEYLGEKSASLLGESEFRYAIHLPETVEQSNAHEMTAGGRTLKWRYKLSECKKKPIVMDLQVPILLPWWVKAGACGLVLLALGGGYVFFQKRSKKRIA